MSVEKVRTINVPGWGRYSVIITWSHYGHIYMQIPSTGSCRTVTIPSTATGDVKKGADRLLSYLAKEQ